MIKALAAIAIAGAQLVNGLTIYTSLPGSIPTQFLGPNGQYTGLPAFDAVTQVPPAAPGGVPTAIAIALPTATTIPNLSSKQQRTDFVGISLEMAVSANVIGRNGTFLNPIFLNHIQNLKARSGKVAIRIGGNSQEKANLVPSWAPAVGPTISKQVDPAQAAPGFPNSPLLTISEDLMYAMNNVSSLVNVGWYYGLPFLNEQAISNTADAVSSILGANLLGFQLANEPDLYQTHLKKPAPYDLPTYMADWGRVRSTYLATRTDLIAPNVCCGWTIDQVLAAGFLTQYAQYLKFVAVQHYKDSACSTGVGNVVDPAAAFVSYQTHSSAQSFMARYVTASGQINASGKDFVLLETNTASCGGFAGSSDSYAAALYLTDLALQAASIGIAQVLLHNGGEGQFYNLFTPPPSNMSSFRKWTTTSPYYSALIMAEVMSEEGSQVGDLLLNNNNTFTPGYAIYKNNNPIKLALFNYMNDPSGAHDVIFAVSVGAGSPASVQVKYFSSSTGSTADKFNLTWAGQTMGDEFASDGRLQGAEAIVTIQCSGTCNIPVKAPQFALVFLDSVPGVDPAQATQTFATSVLTRVQGGNVIVPPSVLATSNGRGGEQELLNIGQTSQGRTSDATRTAVRSGLVLLVVGFISGVWLAMR